MYTLLKALLTDRCSTGTILLQPVSLPVINLETVLHISCVNIWNVITTFWFSALHGGHIPVHCQPYWCSITMFLFTQFTSVFILNYELTIYKCTVYISVLLVHAIRHITRPRSVGVPKHFCTRSSVGSPPGLPTCSPLSPSHTSSVLCLSTSFTVSLAAVSPGDIGQSRLDGGRLISSPVGAWWLAKSCFFVFHSRTSWPKPGGTNTYTVTTSTSAMVILGYS